MKINLVKARSLSVFSALKKFFKKTSHFYEFGMTLVIYKSVNKILEIIFNMEGGGEYVY